MPKTKHTELDDELLHLLDGGKLEGKIGIALQFVTVTPDGMPHSALLSVGEVLALGPRHLRLALWASSVTTGNLRSSPKALLTVVVAGVYYSIELDTGAPSPEGTVLPENLAVFEGEVRSIYRDEVGYADLLGGITFRLVDPASVLARWERTVTALRGVAHGDTARQGGSR